MMDYRAILPVLFFEYLSLSLSRSILPSLIVNAFGGYSYLLIGLVESFKGLLSFIFCPLIGKLSDRYGRKYCLLLSMLGTTLPVCFLAFYPNMWIYSLLVAMSGVFSATFALTFAYISDCVEKEHCAAAYGIALATFGLSFTIGPLIGAIISSQYEPNLVFRLSNVLVAVNTFYIFSILPETIHSRKLNASTKPDFRTIFDLSDTTKIFWEDPFLANVAVIVLLYYSAVWAIVSTLMVFVTKQLHVDPLELGYLLSSYGIMTMFSEGILVRVFVPRFGELVCIRIGLLAYAAQSIIIAFASNVKWVYFSMIFSVLSNLVYPSICSMVTKVSGTRQGEALGSLNGIKALTEGLGPLVFGFLMSLFEQHLIPGAPYLLVSVISLWALLHTYELPSDLDVVFGKYANAKEPESVQLLSIID